MQAYERKLN